MSSITRCSIALLDTVKLCASLSASSVRLHTRGPNCATHGAGLAKRID